VDKCGSPPLAILIKDFLFVGGFQRTQEVSGNEQVLSGTGRFERRFFWKCLTGKGFIALACWLNFQGRPNRAYYHG
jgi:hypothetical protein